MCVCKEYMYITLHAYIRSDTVVWNCGDLDLVRLVYILCKTVDSSIRVQEQVCSRRHHSISPSTWTLKESEQIQFSIIAR